jgi:hypothetical protein
LPANIAWLYGPMGSGASGEKMTVLILLYFDYALKLFPAP